MKITRCDRCAKDCPPVTFALVKQFSTVVTRRGTTLDLCSACRDQLGDWLDGPRKTSEALKQAIEEQDAKETAREVLKEARDTTREEIAAARAEVAAQEYRDCQPVDEAGPSKDYVDQNLGVIPLDEPVFGSAARKLAERMAEMKKPVRARCANSGCDHIYELHSGEQGECAVWECKCLGMKR